MLLISFVQSLDPAKTKASVPDPDTFILNVTDSKGNSVYSGSFGAAPEQLLVNPGTYTIGAKSREFSAPLFDAPQYGDEQVVSVKAGTRTSVQLNCVQQNAGILLNISDDFLSEYSDGVLFLSGNGGRLMYSMSEKRIAYFLPGSVSLSMTRGSEQQTLFTRRLSAQEILRVNLTVASGSSSSGGKGISIAVDTSRTWLSESFIMGGSSSGSDKANALSVPQALEHIGEQDVWVYGFIVGGDLSSSRCSFEPPFTSRTNLVLASKSSCTNKEQCLSVQLAAGDIREELNLVDHEELLGKKVWLKGDIVPAYYGIPGLQSISEYSF